MFKRFSFYFLLFAMFIGLGGCGDIIDNAIKNALFDSNTTYAVTDGHTADSPIPVTSNIVSLNSITLLVNLEHNRTGDLKMVLRSPAGIDVILSDHRGGDNGIIQVSFLEDTPRSITDADFPVQGSYQPEENLSMLHSTNPNGTWHLRISDTVTNGKEGRLNSWLLVIGGDKE